MKKVIFVWVVILLVCAILAIHFSFPTKARADESTINYQKQAVIFLCDDNAELAQTLDDLVGINIIYFNTDNIEVIISPTSHFFMVIKQMVMAGRQKEGYAEILDELLKENTRLKLTLKQRTFRARKNQVNINVLRGRMNNPALFFIPTPNLAWGFIGKISRVVVKW